MGDINPSKMPTGKRKARRDDTDFTQYKEGGKVNAAGNYTKPMMRKRLFAAIKAGGKGGAPGQWSARKAQMLANLFSFDERTVGRIMVPRGDVVMLDATAEPEVNLATARASA